MLRAGLLRELSPTEYTDQYAEQQGAVEKYVQCIKEFYFNCLYTKLMKALSSTKGGEGEEKIAKWEEKNTER